MAMFQQYQNGVTPVTGMAEAGANIGKMYMQGIGQMGESLAKGIQAYNENSAKSEMANVKIQSLSQDITNKIAMYSQDPEIAQSGILQGLMQKGQMLTEAPSKGLSQRLAIAHDAETSLAGFGQQLQEWSFLRGRAIERGIQEGLNRFKETKSITSPVFYDGSDPLLAVDPNQNIQQQKDRVLKRFRDIKVANPAIEGTEEQFWANWISNAEQRFAKGVDGVAPTVSSAQLEALQAERNILKSQSDVDRLDAGAIGGLIMNKDGLYEEQANVSVPVKDYEATMKSAEQMVTENTEEGMKNLFGFDKDMLKPDEALTGIANKAKDEIKALREKEASLLTAIEQEKKNSYFGKKSSAENTFKNAIRSFNDLAIEQGSQFVKIDPKTGKPSIDIGVTARKFLGAGWPGGIVAEQTGIFDDRSQYQKDLVSSFAEKQKTKELLSIDDKKGAVETIRKDIKTQQSIIEGVSKASEMPVRTPSPKVALRGDVVVGSTTYERPVSVSERKSQVQDFLTERFGAIDPTDPTGKRRIPVQGFESFFAKAVPESEIKEFTTESGQKLIHLNGKWEMVKSAEPRSLADIRKDMVGVYGKQTADGRLVPTEFIPNSGIEIGGLYRGTDASEAQFNDEMTQLSDARRSIRKLQEINDSVGEFADLTKAGIAEVEVMNLKSALRKDIIGVGTVSNFEQSLIDKVIRNPTDFFSMESKDRAILLALAQRIDRRIQNIGAAKGLTVRIRDVDSGNRYEALRQQYLKAKGLL